jgi:hypothetical protein
MAWPWRKAPVVIDAPGVFVGGDGDEGRPQVVPWEAIHEIVLYETVVARAGDVRRADAVGLRLRRRPEVISVQRVLRSWELDRAELEAAVARFAPDVAVVDGPSQDPLSGDQLQAQFDEIADSVREAGAEDDDGVRRPAEGEPLYGPRSGVPERPPASPPTPAPVHGTAAEPGAPAPAPSPVGHGAAYVVKPDGSTIGSPLLFAAIGAGIAAYGAWSGVWIAALFGLAFLWPLLKHWNDARRGVVYFCADADGLYLGEARDADDHTTKLSLPWSAISTVVVFDVEKAGRDSDGDRTSTWHRAVGVTLPDSRGAVAHFMVFDDFKLDRAHLETAVEAHGGGVPVVDGPAVGSRSLRDVAGGLFDVLRDRRDGSPPGTV